MRKVTSGFFLFLMLLGLVLAPAPAQAQSGCGGTSNCIYAYVLYKCNVSNKVPPQPTLYVNLKATNTTVVTTHYLTTEQITGNQRLMSVKVTSVSTANNYDARFVQNGSVIQNWYFVGRPPTTTGLVKVVSC